MLQINKVTNEEHHKRDPVQKLIGQVSTTISDLQLILATRGSRISCRCGDYKQYLPACLTYADLL
jgi:hypothetical protein